MCRSWVSHVHSTVMGRDQHGSAISSCQVWLGNVPESIRWKELREHIDQADDPDRLEQKASGPLSTILLKRPRAGPAIPLHQVRKHPKIAAAMLKQLYTYKSIRPLHFVRGK